jgi:hypothetical protein
MESQRQAYLAHDLVPLGAETRYLHVTRKTLEQLHALTGVDRSLCPHCHTGTMAIVERVPTVRDRPVVAATPAFEDSR